MKRIGANGLVPGMIGAAEVASADGMRKLPAVCADMGDLIDLRNGETRITGFG